MMERHEANDRAGKFTDPVIEDEAVEAIRLGWKLSHGAARNEFRIAIASGNVQRDDLSESRQQLIAGTGLVGALAMWAASKTDKIPPTTYSLGDLFSCVEQRLGKPKQLVVAELTPAGELLTKTAKKRGPVRGTVRRFETQDKELVPEIDRIMANNGFSKTAACKRLAEEGRVAGGGTPESKAKRLLRLYNETKTLSY